MVTVIKPETHWKIRLITEYIHCPYKCYPANYWGCTHEEHPHRKVEVIPECAELNCPLLYEEY